MCKPTLEMIDEVFKREALATIRLLGEVVVLADNEPVNVNVFREECPDALTVWVQTDHSPRPIGAHPDIPGIRGFVRTTDHGARLI